MGKHGHVKKVFPDTLMFVLYGIFFLSLFVLVISTWNIDYNGVICSLMKMWAGED